MFGQRCEAVEDIQALQQQYRVDPAELARKIQFSTFTENGKPIGVRLQAGRDAALMRLMNQAGLRPTDIITSVNGVPLNDVDYTVDLDIDAYVEIG